MQQPDKSNSPSDPAISRTTAGGSLPERLRSLATWGNVVLLDRWVGRLGPLLLLIFAFCYYGQYYRSGLNLGGEGGTVGVIALRLMEGQRPIVDTFLGYNVMWFYPVVWLFQVFGPNYVILRIFFFAICTVGAVLGFCVVRRATGSGLYAVLVSSLLVLMPGMIFRNYMPFLGLLNMFLLLHAFVFSTRSLSVRLVWLVAFGAGLGLTFLIRIELGIFFSIIALGLAALYPIGVRGQFRARLPVAIGGALLAFLIAGLVHLPVYFDAKARGFDAAFVGQYQVWLNFLGTGIKREFGGKPAPKPTPVPVEAPSAAPAATPASVPPSENTDREVLRRLSFSDMGKLPSFYDQAFVMITYLPILVSIILVAASGIAFLLSLRWGDEAMRESALVVLTACGCSLALFPQFFFFRPDTPHLSEFMAPFLVALGCAAWQGLRIILARPSLVLRVACLLIVTLCVANAGLYTYHTMPKESGGTIAAAEKRSYEFVADNGVRVLLKRREISDYKKIYDAIVSNSGPNDYVVCYPYSPTINFMTNRRSYEYNLYVDNATASRKFHENLLKGIKEKAPAVIVIDNRDINQSDSSRFATWAGKTYAYINQTYRKVGSFKRQEIYVRPNPAPDSPISLQAQ